MRDNIQQEVKQFKSVFDEHSTPDNQSDGGSIVGSDVYEIFNNIYNVFKDLDLVSDGETPEDGTFKFIHAYPDEIRKEGVNVITFRIKSRTPGVSNSRAVPNSKFSSLVPRAIQEGYNSVTGMYEIIYHQTFDNIVALTIFSSKARAVNLLAQIIESVFTKYRSEISAPDTTYFYLGMSDVGFLDRDSQDPIFTRELTFHFKTGELTKREGEQLKEINLASKF